MMVMVIMLMLKGDKSFLGDAGRHDDDDEDAKMSLIMRAAAGGTRWWWGVTRGSQPQGHGATSRIAAPSSLSSLPVMVSPLL